MISTYLGNDHYEIMLCSSGKYVTLTEDEIEEIVEESSITDELREEVKAGDDDYKKVITSIEEQAKIIRELTEYVEGLKGKKVRAELEAIIEELDTMSQYL